MTYNSDNFQLLFIGFFDANEAGIAVVVVLMFEMHDTKNAILRRLKIKKIVSKRRKHNTYLLT